MLHQVIKIAIDGSVSVSKTTTINCLRPAFVALNALDRANGDPGPVVEFVTEAAREVFERFPDLDRAGHEADWRIANKIMANEARAIAETGAQVLVCDRSILSVLAFAKVNDALHYKRLLKDPQVQAHIQTYDTFLLLSPKNVPFIQDDVRIEDETFRTRLHDVYYELYKDLGLTYTELEGPTLTRVGTVLQKVQDAYWPRKANEAA